MRKGCIADGGRNVPATVLRRSLGGRKEMAADSQKTLRCPR